jgi:hypothetical protein
VSRPLQIAAWSYVAACAVGVAIVTLWRADPPPAEPHLAPVAAVTAAPNTAEGWFQEVKPFCNAVEVEVQLRNRPAPASVAGAGYSAACYALAGRIELARGVVDAIAPSERLQAVAIVFDVAHPVADAGDDKSAGPIMEMVVDYWPNHYMALYHAGMSAFILGQPDRARRHLESFLTYYSSDDGWRRNALDVLGRLGRP